MDNPIAGGIYQTYLDYRLYNSRHLFNTYVPDTCSCWSTAVVIIESILGAVTGKYYNVIHNDVFFHVQTKKQAQMFSLFMKYH